MITQQEAVGALLRSGYLLESRVASQLRDRGWVVETNSAYIDAETGKSRELDVYAVSGSKIDKGGESASYVFQRLLIECQHPAQPLVFITARNISAARKIEYLREVTDPPFVRGKDGWYRLAEHLNLEKYHHYCSEGTAVQYCSFAQKRDGSGWFALHEDSQHSCFTGLTQAVDFHVEELLRQQRYIMSQPLNERTIHVELVYPIVVVDGDLLEVNQSGDFTGLTPVQRVNYRRSVFVDGAVHDYMIVVVTENALPNFIETLGCECDRIASDIHKKRLKFVAAQKRLAKLSNEELAELPVVVSPHLERIVAYLIETRGVSKNDPEES